MKILLFGKNGQVGWELNRSLLPLGEVIALGREDADFANPESLREIVQTIKPDVIVNAVAYTAVDKAEEEEELAAVINGAAPAALAQEAKKIKALFVHYSTDYIFDGTKESPYDEADEPKPINAYGRTKLAGERAIQSSGCDYLIIRTSWVYSARGSNFLLTMLRLASERRELTVVNDQVGAPTWARNIADVTAGIILASNKQRLKSCFFPGIYNVTSDGAISWFDFARAIVEIAAVQRADGKLMVEQINPVSSENYSAAAARPLNSVLSTDKIQSHFGFSSISWKSALEYCMASIKC